MRTPAGRRGAAAHAIGRSRGGLTTKVHAAVDGEPSSAIGPRAMASGLPARLAVTPGQGGDGRRARGLLGGLADQGRIARVIADAAYDADRMRSFVVVDLGFRAQIKPDPSRAGEPGTDWALYTERHLVGRVFNHCERRRIAPRWGRALASFAAFPTSHVP